ncbi:MAG: hypothetical protein AUK63_789 [bacterium P3]|nr:MAG: hypothetical protein AUK63_789 [bacterium P3]
MANDAYSIADSALHPGDVANAVPRLGFELHGNAFFIDNEHSGSSRVNGYTIPGVSLQPRLTWRLDRRVSLQTGVHWLHFWGNNSPYDKEGVDLLCTAIDSTQPAMLQPWVQLRLDPADWVTLVLGNLINTDGHRLPLPLYNPERTVAAEPEAGVQILLKRPWLLADVWVDWQQFIWNNSPRRERFIAGVSAEASVKTGDWRLYAPMYLLAQHLGGEDRSDTTHSVQTYYNAAAGLGVSRQLGTVKLRADCSAMFFYRDGDKEGSLNYVNADGWVYLSGPPLNFKRGWGVYPRLTAEWGNLWAEATFWSGEKFIPLLGCYHYSNVSVNTSDMTHDRIRVAALRMQWTPDKMRYCTMHIYGAYYHYFPFTADRTSYSKVEGKAADIFSVGVTVEFNFAVPLLQ